MFETPHERVSNYARFSARDTYTWRRKSQPHIWPNLKTQLTNPTHKVSKTCEGRNLIFLSHQPATNKLDSRRLKSPHHTQVWVHKWFLLICQNWGFAKILFPCVVCDSDGGCMMNLWGVECSVMYECTSVRYFCMLCSGKVIWDSRSLLEDCWWGEGVRLGLSVMGCRKSGLSVVQGLGWWGMSAA